MKLEEVIEKALIRSGVPSTTKGLTHHYGPQIECVAAAVRKHYEAKVRELEDEVGIFKLREHGHFSDCDKYNPCSCGIFTEHLAAEQTNKDSVSTCGAVKEPEVVFGGKFKDMVIINGRSLSDEEVKMMHEKWFGAVKEPEVVMEDCKQHPDGVCCDECCSDCDPKGANR